MQSDFYTKKFANETLLDKALLELINSWKEFQSIKRKSKNETLRKAVLKEKILFLSDVFTS